MVFIIDSIAIKPQCFQLQKPPLILMFKLVSAHQCDIVDCPVLYLHLVNLGLP